MLQWKPRIPVYLTGPKPFGSTWCATCAVLWMGHVSNDPAMQKFVRKAESAAADAKQPYVAIELPEDSDTLPVLQLAVTVAPSVYSQTPMPVCWTHILPYRFPTKEERDKMKPADAAIGTQNPLIVGKAHWTPKGGF